jgi:hypothetical protein
MLVLCMEGRPTPSSEDNVAMVSEPRHLSPTTCSVGLSG